MEATIELGSEQYSEFIRCLANLKEICNDADIRGGFIRQRTNDKTSIFEMNLKPIFQEQEVDMALVNLKQKFELLKMFQGQDVTIDITDDFFKFTDQYGMLRFINPPVSYVDNAYMTEEEINTIFSVDEDQLIFSKDLESITTDRIRVVTQTFNILAIQVSFEEDKAEIKAAAQSKDQWATFIKDIETNMVFEKSEANLSIIPFTIDHDSDIEFKMYKDPSRNVSLNLFSTNLGSVDIRIFSRASIHEEQ
jgi:hypothetical protein